MKRSDTYIKIRCCDGEKKIKEISSEVYELLLALYRADPELKLPSFIQEKKESVGFSIPEYTEKDAINLIKETILDFFKKDIKKYNGVENPSENFSREEGFLLCIVYHKAQNVEVSFILRIGAEKRNMLTLLAYRNGDMLPTWCYSIILEMAKIKFVNNSCLFLRSDLFFELEKKHGISIGVITYLPNEVLRRVKIIDPEIQCNQTENGFIYTITLNDFTRTEDELLTVKSKIEKIYSELILV